MRTEAVALRAAIASKRPSKTLVAVAVAAGATTASTTDEDEETTDEDEETTDEDEEMTGAATSDEDETRTAAQMVVGETASVCHAR